MDINELLKINSKLPYKGFYVTTENRIGEWLAGALRRKIITNSVYVKLSEEWYNLDYHFLKENPIHSIKINT